MFVYRENPQVLWSQDRYNILLTVDVKEVPKSADVVQMTSDSELSFAAIANSVCYAFSFALFDLVNTAELEVCAV